LTLGFSDKVFCEDHPQDPTCLTASGGNGGNGGSAGQGGSSGGNGGSGGSGVCDPQAPLFGDSLENAFELTWSVFEEDKIGASGFATCAFAPSGPSNCFYMDTKLSSQAWWYEEFSAPLRYRTVCGNFAMWARVQVSESNGSTNAITAPFSGGGLMVRDAAHGDVPQGFDERWAMITLGLGATTPSDYITTVWGRSTPGSGTVNTMPLAPTGGALEALLMICRANGQYRFMSRLSDATPVDHGVPSSLDADFLATDVVQAGMTIHAFQPPEPAIGVRGWFDYVYFERITDLSDCDILVGSGSIR
jgi:hypothetical protein